MLIDKLQKQMDAVLHTGSAFLTESVLEASRKLKHLVVVGSPGLAEEAIYPRRGYYLLTLFVFLSLVYGIGRLVVATIKDHRD